jgi:hypothetical protein
MEWMLELCQKMSVLWDPNHPKYYNKLLKDDAWEDIAKNMRTVSGECKKMTSVLSSLRKEREREREREREEEYGKAGLQESVCVSNCNCNKQKCDSSIPE